ncbi:hypothetical protein FEM41_17340 [Jejubacter calystegiae]|uniref:Uncharacterized protein n=1 Tax=Jejubacter calystegiae TaxID=2579935 RepID=A0A4V1G7Y7_9ENTR|nr:hypothetical protein FEM41_17340 [Jejubacter calystegiae]
MVFACKSEWNYNYRRQRPTEMKPVHHNQALQKNRDNGEGNGNSIRGHQSVASGAYSYIRFNIIYIMRTNDKDGRIWWESFTLAVNWLLSTVIQNHPFLQTNQNQMSVSSK